MYPMVQSSIENSSELVEFDLAVAAHKKFSPYTSTQPSGNLSSFTKSSDLSRQLNISSAIFAGERTFILKSFNKLGVIVREEVAYHTEF